MRRVHVKRKRAEAILSEAAKRKLTSSVQKVERAEIIGGDTLSLFVVNDEPLILFDDDEGIYVPFIASVGKFVFCPSVVVDMGAVPYVVNGADVMAPGIVSCGEFERGDIVCVKTERHERVIATGYSMMSSGEIRSIKKGKAVKNVHYVGDRYWKLAKDIFHL
ncbi:MAG: PUA domain-containing protein [Candidatus Geothermarchaeales archaeon]